MSIKRKIKTDLAPQAIGPYAQAQQVGPWVYTSGQIPLQIDGQIVEGGIAEQTRQVLENLKAVLKAAGSTLDDVIKVTIYIQDMNEFSIINDIYGQYFGERQPARSCVEVSRLPKDVRIELDCVAYTD